MPAKAVFTKEQHKLIQEAAVRVWETQFKGTPSAQKQMAKSLKITQQSVSMLLRGRYRPGIRVADEIATLDGRNALEELVGPYGEEEVAVASGKPSRVAPHDGPSPFANLNVCVQFFAATKHWSAWTVAAARAGFFGNSDYPPPEWASKLDMLEKVLERARKTG